MNTRNRILVTIGALWLAAVVVLGIWTLADSQTDWALGPIKQYPCPTDGSYCVRANRTTWEYESRDVRRLVMLALVVTGVAGAAAVVVTLVWTRPELKPVA